MTQQLKVSVFVFCYIVNPFDCSLVSFILIEMRARQKPASSLVACKSVGRSVHLA